MLGPGINLYKQCETVQGYISEKHSIVITINYVDKSFDIDYLFLSNSKRYVQMATMLSKNRGKYKIIATSNVTKSEGFFDYVLRYSSLIEPDAEVIDNSFLMFLKVLEKVGVSEVAIAGFDGYKGSEEADYIRLDMEYYFDKEKALRINQHVIKKLEEKKGKIDITFLTDSMYNK